MARKRVLVGIDEAHALGTGIATGRPAGAGRERLDLWKDLLGEKVGDLAHAGAVHAERRVHVEAVAAAGASYAGRRHDGIAVGHEYDAREVAADERLERGAQFGEVTGQSAVEDLL